MELPYGFTKERIKEIIKEWEEIAFQLSTGKYPFNEIKFDEVFEDDEYIDRYIWWHDAEFCISTEKESGEHYISEFMYLSQNGYCDSFCINDLREMVA